MATPLTDDEARFLDVHGFGALDERLGDADIDAADLWRRSAVSD